MADLIFVTSNSRKFEVAQKALGAFGINLTHKNIENLHEIQSTDVNEISAFSAKLAANELNAPVIVEDAGYYIEALNGFPGPFIKFTNNWLSAEDYLLLMSGKENRKIEVRSSLAYCVPGQEPVVFCSSAFGKMPLSVGPVGYSPINQVFIPEGFSQIATEISDEEMLNFWSEKLDTWSKLAEYLGKNK